MDKSGKNLGFTTPFTTVATVFSVAVSSSNPKGLLLTNQTIPRIITMIPGKTVPTKKPAIVTLDRIFVPPKAIKVASQ